MERLYQFPLKQHAGAPSVPVVEPGQSVLRGQCIAEKPENALGANIFSSVTGTVQEVSEKASPFWRTRRRAWTM